MSSSSARPLKRAVVDLNLFISGLISKQGLPNRLVSQFRQGAFALVVTQQMRDELEEVLQREKFTIRYRISQEEREDILYLIDTKGIIANPRRRLPVTIRDPKDEIVLATALGGRADLIVTGDADLLVLNGDPRLGNLQIITVRTFLELIEQDA